MPFKRKKVPTVLSIFALLLSAGIITSCSSNNSQIDNNSLASVKFEDESVTLKVGDIVEITPFLSTNASLSDFNVILSNQNITYEINGETILITGVSDGLTTLTLRAKDQGAFEDSILIVVAPSDSSLPYHVKLVKVMLFARARRFLVIEVVNTTAHLKRLFLHPCKMQAIDNLPVLMPPLYHIFVEAIDHYQVIAPECHIATP